PEEIRAAILRFGQHFDAVLDGMTALPRTITHSDFRLDNLFFTDDPAAPLAAIDWQLTLRSHGPFDLAYFMSMSLETDVRRAHEAELLDLYHRTLVAGGVQGFSRENLAVSYRRGLSGGLLMPIAVANLDTANERGVRLFLAMIQRMVAAMMDHRVWEILP
ncbi:MAG: oxidoreductase family protein, partial [Dehalococcoidia bacterium]